MTSKSGNIIVFTDGSCVGNGRNCAKGGIGIHFPNGELPDISKKFKLNPITNQRTELYAIYYTLKYIKCNLGLNGKTIVIKTDSMYSINALTLWIKKWKKNNWLTNEEKPVLNQDIIRAVDKYLQKYSVILLHVNAHTGGTDYDSIHNDIADKLSRQATCDQSESDNLSISSPYKTKCNPKFHKKKTQFNTPVKNNISTGANGAVRLNKGYGIRSDIVVELIE